MACVVGWVKTMKIKLYDNLDTMNHNIYDENKQQKEPMINEVTKVLQCMTQPT